MQPCSAWWQLFTSNFNGDVQKLNCNATFYCGDSGGRLVGDTTRPWQDGADAWSPGHYVGTDRQYAMSSGVFDAVMLLAFSNTFSIVF